MSIVETQQAQFAIAQPKKFFGKKRKQTLDAMRTCDPAIAILGFGLGAAQIGVSTAPYIIPQQPPPKPIQLPLTRLSSYSCILRHSTCLPCSLAVELELGHSEAMEQAIRMWCDAAIKKVNG